MVKRATAPLILVWLLAAMAAAARGAQGTPFSPLVLNGAQDFVVCGADRSQHKPAVACEPSSQICLVVWEDYRAGPYVADIYGRLIASDGSPVRQDIPVCAVADNQYEPEVAYNSSAHEYLVVWYDGRYEDNRFYIRGQRVSAAGALLGNRIDIATATNWQINPALAYNSRDNEYLVAWEDGAVNIMARRNLKGKGIRARAGALLFSTRSRVGGCCPTGVQQTPLEGLEPPANCLEGSCSIR